VLKREIQKVAAGQDPMNISFDETSAPISTPSGVVKTPVGVGA
jgi:hypothetical protein